MPGKLIFFCAASLMGLLLAAAVSAAPAQAVPTPEREQLLNGLVILFGPQPGDQNVVLKLRLHSGAAFDLAGKAGTMALLGDALFPDPATREYVSEQLGGRLDVSTSYDSIDVTISGKASELERMMELLRNAILGLNLSAENVTRLREARIKLLAAHPLSAADIANEAIANRLFGSFPYANQAEGTEASVAKVDRADLMLAQDRFLHADNATLAVIGGVDKSRLMRDARQLLGPWQKGDRTIPATFRQPAAPDQRILLINDASAKTTEIRLAVRGLARADRDAAAASVLAVILQARWQTAMPDLAASVFVSHQAHELPGMFVLGANVPITAANKVIAATQELMRLVARDGVTAAELDQGRSAAAAAEMKNRRSQAETIADAWLDSEIYKLSPGAGTNAFSRVSAADVQRVANRLLKDTPQAIVAVGDVSQLKLGLGSNVEIPGAQPDANKSSDSSKPPRKP